MLKLFRAGPKFAIFFCVENNSCPVLEFLEELKQGGAPQQKDYETLVTRRLERTAESGPPYNPEHCKELEDGIYEFKAANGSRLLWFYDATQRAVVVCTHGFHKPPSNRGYRAQIDRAKATRVRYEAFVAQWRASLAQAGQSKKKT